MFRTLEGGDGLHSLVPDYNSGSLFWANALSATESGNDSEYTLDVPAKLILDKVASPHNVCKGHPFFRRNQCQNV